MAVRFQAESTGCYRSQNNLGILTAVPFTMACWFYSIGNSNVPRILMSLGINGQIDQSWWLSILGAGNTPANTVAAVARTTSNAQATSSPRTYVNNQWHHACAVFSANNNRQAYLDGVAGLAETTNRAVTATKDATVIGCNTQQTINNDVSFYMSGVIAEAAIWNFALRPADVLGLANGARTTKVRPGNLVGYWPLYGHPTPILEPDWSPGSVLPQRFDMRMTRSLVQFDHPHIGLATNNIYPQGYLEGAAAVALGFGLGNHVFDGSVFRTSVFSK